MGKDDKNSKQQISKETKGKLKIGIVLGSLLGICLIFVVAHTLKKPVINLNEYITVSFDGYDTVGNAVVEFDTDRFRQEYRGKLRSSFVSDYVDWSLDHKQNLSNGDLILLSWDCEDEKVLSRCGYTMEYEDVSYTVEGLEEIETFDPFAGIDVKFEGISAYGNAEIVGSPSETAAQELNYDLDRYYELKNGDIVTMSVTAYGSNPDDYCIKHYGMKPTTLTKTYTVDGLSQYVQNLSEISEEGLTQMQAQAKDVFDAYVAKEWDDEKLIDFTYLGNYLLTEKSEESYSTHNECYLVYKVNIQHAREDYNKINEMYWFIAFEDLLVAPDGTVSVDLTEWKKPNKRVTFYPEGHKRWSWRYYGYATLEELYKDVVTSKVDAFNHDDGVQMN